MGKLALLKIILSFGAAGAARIPGMPVRVSSALKVANTALTTAEGAVTGWAQAKGQTVEELIADLDKAHPQHTAEIKDWIAELEGRAGQG